MVSTDFPYDLSMSKLNKRREKGYCVRYKEDFVKLRFCFIHFTVILAGLQRSCHRGSLNRGSTVVSLIRFTCNDLHNVNDIKKVNEFSKIQLVVYYQCCLLIG